jgi:hypothetical protein
MTPSIASAKPISQSPDTAHVHYDPTGNYFAFDAIGVSRAFFDTVPEDPSYPAYHSPADGEHREAWTKKVLMTIEVCAYLHTFEPPPKAEHVTEVKNGKR